MITCRSCTKYQNILPILLQFILSKPQFCYKPKKTHIVARVKKYCTENEQKVLVTFNVRPGMTINPEWSYVGFSFSLS